MFYGLNDKISYIDNTHNSIYDFAMFKILVTCRSGHNLLVINSLYAFDHV